ncbi:hypothetical protein [Streptomyces sp. NPDC048269]|uniref:hypothetical protein n=1 Tax=Streptomyces sp. NPDC048269 TaxID=3155753 RepID=UPI0034410247
MKFQRDGNLVIYRADGKAIWASGTFWQGANGLEIQMGGNVVIYKNQASSSTPVRATNTYNSC